MKNLFRVPFAMLMASMIFLACTKEEEVPTEKQQDTKLEDTAEQNRIVSENPTFYYQNVAVEAITEESVNIYHNDELMLSTNLIVNDNFQSIEGEDNSITFRNLNEGYTDQYISINNVVLTETGLRFNITSSNSELNITDVELENIEFDEEGKFCWKCAWEIVTMTVPLILDQMFEGNEDISVPTACLEAAKLVNCPPGQSLVFIIDEGWFTTDCYVSCG